MASIAAWFYNGLRRRWVHYRNNQRTAALARSVAEHSKVPTGRPIIVMNTSTRLDGVSLNAGFSLTSAWGLRLSGTPVVHFVCNAGLHPCVLGTDRSDPQSLPPCRICMAQSQILYTGADVRWFQYRVDEDIHCSIQSLDLAGCMAFQHQGMPLGELVLPSVRWILRKHHLEDDDPTRYLYRQYILSAWSLAQQFSKLLDEIKPQAVLVFNGMFYPEATARWVASQCGIPSVAHEVGLRPYSGYFTTGDATAYPISIPAGFELSPAQNALLDQYLDQRFQGNFSMAGVRFWPEMKNLGPEFWEKATAYRQIVPVFTNVIFDTSQGHANVIFEHMFAWLDAVLDLIRRHPETYFVIRAHPDEARPGKESQESVAKWVRRNRVDQLDHVLFVDADEYFSSYELILRSKFVMVYNSTIGLEASLMGAAVLCGGRARFTQLPTVFFPKTAESYLQLAEEFLDCDSIQVPAEFRLNARRFLYYQLYKSSLPFGDFLREDGVWNGFVAFKPVSWEALLPEKSQTIKTIVNGILDSSEFLLEEIMPEAKE